MKNNSAMARVNVSTMRPEWYRVAVFDVIRVVTGLAVILDCWRPGKSPRDADGKPTGIQGRDCCGVLICACVTFECSNPKATFDFALNTINCVLDTCTQCPGIPHYPQKIHIQVILKNALIIPFMLSTILGVIILGIAMEEGTCLTDD